MQFQRPFVDSRDAQNDRDVKRPRSVTPRTEPLSGQSSDRSRGGSASVRSERSLTEKDKTRSSSGGSHRNKLEPGGARTGRPDQKVTGKRSSSRQSDITEDLSTAVDTDSNARSSRKTGDSRRKSKVVRLVFKSLINVLLIMNIFGSSLICQNIFSRLLIQSIDQSTNQTLCLD